MKLRCVKGNIGLDGVRYSIGDVFDADDGIVSDALINGNFAEMVVEPEKVVDPVTEDAVVDEVVEPEPEEVVDKPPAPKRGRKPR